MTASHHPPAPRRTALANRIADLGLQIDELATGTRIPPETLTAYIAGERPVPVNHAARLVSFLLAKSMSGRPGSATVAPRAARRPGPVYALKRLDPPASARRPDISTAIHHPRTETPDE